MNNRGRPVVISATSGTGKTTIIEGVLKKRPDLIFSVSATTRKPRAGEIDGVHYRFITRDEFKRGIEDNRFAEWEEVHGEFYGTEREKLEHALDSGNYVLLDLDVNGGERIKKAYPEAILIFLYPPSLQELRRRLIDRHTESSESMKRRLDRYPMEHEKGTKYPFHVMNSDVGKAIEEVIQIIKNNGKIKV